MKSYNIKEGSEKVMIIEKTDRLVCKSEMDIVDGFPVPHISNTKEINLFSIKPMTGREFGFVFYDKDSDEIVCQIHFENKRRDYEISYGTYEKYRGKKYMQEALRFFVKWVFEKTSIDCLYGLINNNITSQHILEKLGFELENVDEFGTWFVLKRGCGI